MKTKLEAQKAYERRTGYAAQTKYRRENIKRLTLELNKKTDSDILEHLDAQVNKAGYIKSLIRSAMNV